MTMNQLSYKVLSERSIFVFPDTPPKHAQYDEQVIQTFYISHADATELSQMLSTIIRLPRHRRAAGRSQSTRRPTRIIVRGTSSVVQIIEKIIAQNDKPRAEIVFDVEILEVDRDAGEELRPEPVRVRHRRRLLAGGRAGRCDHDTAGTGRRAATDRRPRRRPAVDAAERVIVAAAVQPEHDLARRQHGRFLSGGADGDRPVPRDRHQHQAGRQAAAARRRGHEADAEARRRRFRSSRPATRRSRPAAPASTR